MAPRYLFKQAPLKTWVPCPPRKTLPGSGYLDTFHGFFCSQRNLGSKHWIIQLGPPHLERFVGEKKICHQNPADFWAEFFVREMSFLAGGKTYKNVSNKSFVAPKSFFLSGALPSTTDTSLVLWSVKVSEYIISQCSIGNELPVLIAKKLISINLTCHIRRYKESIYRSTHKNQELKKKLLWSNRVFDLQISSPRHRWRWWPMGHLIHVMNQTGKHSAKWIHLRRYGKESSYRWKFQKSHSQPPVGWC